MTKFEYTSSNKRIAKLQRDVCKAVNELVTALKITDSDIGSTQDNIHDGRFSELTMSDVTDALAVCDQTLACIACKCRE